nr:hypothetical protein [Betaproteobacteria bacterium]
MLSPKQVRPILSAADPHDPAQANHDPNQPRRGASRVTGSLTVGDAAGVIGEPTPKTQPQAIDLRSLQAQLNERLEHEPMRVHFSDGSVFEGRLADGLPDGNGTWTHPEGMRLEGRWQAGALLGTLSLAYPDGRRFRGEVLNGLAEGIGSTVDSDGTLHEGLYQAGR